MTYLVGVISAIALLKLLGVVLIVMGLVITLLMMVNKRRD